MTHEKEDDNGDEKPDGATLLVHVPPIVESLDGRLAGVDLRQDLHVENGDQKEWNHVYDYGVENLAHLKKGGVG